MLCGNPCDQVLFCDKTKNRQEIQTLAALLSVVLCWYSDSLYNSEVGDVYVVRKKKKI